MNNNNFNMYHEIRDYGKDPLIVNINRLANINNNFRAALWTGQYLQITLMSLMPGEDIGVEMHSNLDQVLKIECGTGVAMMGCCKDSLHMKKHVDKDSAVIIPAGTWHNVINTGNTPLKLFSIYAPPEHPYGTIHRTKKIAEAQEHY